ncbi:ATP-binding protein [Neorhodopirellula pilleata]|uniref:AAA domain (Dynein-related subfamily) n=1 Tax=Neorhodopirellula pilleata TaxID=2714738 RepID=A0A5C6AQY9_9BACT|nr:AAA family ATPase [Neorhodopirellula pilleata]TWU01629.1 AAA domain (dynein-related subfamily) [Neorhodopirellula pilleata]
MAKKKASSAEATSQSTSEPASASGPASGRRVQLPPAEVRYADELTALAAADRHERPEGWSLSPQSIVDFICGSDGVKVGGNKAEARVITEKFVGHRDVVQRCVVTLAGERGLMLVGEPGTAKSMLGELLAVAISGTGSLAVQGTAGTTEDQIRYGWNYAMLLDRGPVREALVPSPVMTGMRDGKVVRFEEITRCLPEVQDALISILSERRMMIPEMDHAADGAGNSLFAAPGFALIATANLRDRGVSEMSAALKRRFNFETIAPIADEVRERELVSTRAAALLAETGSKAAVDRSLVELLVTVFRDLRNGRSDEGWQVTRPSTVMSTAEAVAVATAITRESVFFPSGFDPVSRMPGHLLGVVMKDEAKDRERLLAYWDGPVRRRAEDGSPLWKRLMELRGVLEE